MDDKPIRQSGKLLVQATTQCRPTGWQEKPVTIKVKEGTFPGFEVVDFGKAPWQVTRAQVTLTVTTPALPRRRCSTPTATPPAKPDWSNEGTRSSSRFPKMPYTSSCNEARQASHHR